MRMKEKHMDRMKSERKPHKSEGRQKEENS